jgi:putative IMPACT (imprinted ancient) family translation regulator
MRVEKGASFALTVGRSRFLAVVMPLASPEEIGPLIRLRRGEVRRANHHCWAYRLTAPDGTRLEKTKDDGEVGHPGRVLLEVLRKHDLEGAIVVSRIFGGVKLGVGGVARAFRDAAEGVAAVLPGPASPPRSVPADRRRR